MTDTRRGRVERSWVDDRRMSSALIFFCLAVFVALGVAAILRQNGIAANKTDQILDCHVAGVVAHTHDESCYDADGDLVCPLPERGLHVHGDSCYAEERTLVCSLEEGEGAHTHDESCYDADGNLACGLEESEGHVHGDACYEVERVLVCGEEEVAEEHVHGPACFREATADAPDPEMPGQTFSHQFKDADEALVLGVDVVAPEGALPEGSTMVVELADGEGLDRELVQGALDLHSLELDRPAGRLLDLQAFTLEFLDADGAKVEPAADVTVTLTSPLVDGGEAPAVVAVEGDEDARTRAELAGEPEYEVQAAALDPLREEELQGRELALADDQLAFDACGGYATYVLAETSQEVEMRSEGETVRVVVEAPAEAGIPQGSTIQVVEIGQDTQEYEAYEADALGAIDADGAELARFFDIKILDAEGGEVQPQAPVSVKIKLEDAPTDGEQPSVVHFDESAGDPAPELIPAEVNNLTTKFEAKSFSVYGVVYTVDFSYEVNGKQYEFSIPGGGFVSLEHVVEVLGIAGETSGEEAQADDIGDSRNDELLTLDDVQVSDATREFVADIASVEFSSPELVWVGKAEESTTVGGLKEAYALEIQYSAELTEEQITAINSCVVEAGDWALISLQPFMSEESLTVTMKNGDQFVVMVTDGQVITEYNSIVPGRDYILYVVRNSNEYYALRSDGSSQYVGSSTDALEGLDSSYSWNYGVDEVSCWWYSGSTYLNLANSNNRNVIGRQRDYVFMSPSGSGFDIYRYYDGSKHLSWDTSGFKVTNHRDVAIRVYMKDKPYYDFTVAVNNESYGSVSCAEPVTNENKTNKTAITATPAEGCYFVGWRLGEDILDADTYGATIAAGTLEFPNDNTILTAVFGKNYTSPATQEINEWVDGLLGNPLESEKTAHVVDYDNRMYEIDLSASSSRYTIDQDIRIEFITDISRSMYFPETLLNEQDFTVNGQINLGQWLLNNGDPEEVYYVIGDIDNTATMYAVYYSGNQYFTRWSIVDASYYLPYDNASTSGRIKNVCQISNGQTTISITDRFADNRIFTGKIYTSTPKPPKDTADWDRLSYLTAAVNAVSRAIYRLDPGAEIGLVTFASSANGGTLYGADEEESLINALQSIQPVGGTNQTSAFNLINNSNPPIFTSNSGKRQVALLITDGAPQGTSWEAIERAAGTTEGKGVEIWTLGLALDRVGNNKTRLMNLASDGGYSGNAEDADELVTETKKILEKMLVKAAVIGEVYDTIDPAFYPVDVNGNPIEEGFYYADTSGGAITRHNAAPSDAKKPYYQWVNDNGTWSIAYYNQEIKWPDDGGWESSFFIKAKEDFMGGNEISTNSGFDNRVEANRVKHSGAADGYYWLNEDHSPFRVDYKMPYVNVDELTMNENSTEWTVYLGTEVDPAKELEKLWDRIRVNQVVKDNGVDDEVITITNGNQKYYSDDTLNDAAAPNGTSNETLPLSHFVNPDLIDTLLQQIDNESPTGSAELTYRYFPYGHDTVGTFNIVLTKTIDTEEESYYAPGSHETTEKGENKEVYTLTVTYTPADNGASESYDQTTPGHSAGKVADGYDGETGERIQSENAHVIHVFAKNLEITKQDLSGNNIDTAQFKLYRAAKKAIDPDTGEETSEYEAGAEDLKVGSETKRVVQIGEEMSTSGGVITVDDLSYAPNGTYYLLETKAPDGYNLLTEPIEMHLELTNAYTHYLPPKDSVDEAFTEDNPYNWTQTVDRFSYDSSEVGTGDASKFVMTVKNNPGYELPAAGGPGTNLFYLFGISLIGLASTGLVMKRRMRNAA